MGEDDGRAVAEKIGELVGIVKSHGKQIDDAVENLFQYRDKTNEVINERHGELVTLLESIRSENNGKVGREEFKLHLEAGDRTHNGLGSALRTAIAELKAEINGADGRSGIRGDVKKIEQSVEAIEERHKFLKWTWAWTSGAVALVITAFEVYHKWREAHGR